ncbi:DUF5677 domain-containing protein [Arthrobacter sp. 92]|uniref:DUF5677 domain-containing protein n=1 Tax=Arthrobacter sp. 92 TaxID=3418175 RepID=UPI003D01CB99
MQTADAGDVVPERYIVNFDVLRGESHEIAYLKESFEILKETGSWIALALSIREEGQGDELPRDQAICAGQLVRMYKITRLVLRQIIDDHGGDHQMALSREFLESASTVAYLLDAPSDSGRFLSFLHDSLIQESQLLKTIEGLVKQRGGEVWPIEERMRRSALDTFRQAGVDPSEVPSRKNNGWPPAEARIKLLGPAAYTAYRAGSSAVHGTWSDVLRNHIESEGQGFVPVFEATEFRPQVLLMMGVLSTVILQGYVGVFAPTPAPSIVEALTDLRERIKALDAAHEEFLKGVVSDGEA